MFEVKGLASPLDSENKKILMTTEMKVKDLLDRYTLNKLVNRDVSSTKVSQLRKYIDTYDSEIGIYFPAVILAATEDPKKINTENLTVQFSDSVKFIVLDGQHRIKALESFKNQQIDNERLIEVLMSTVTVQIYFNLKEQEQRQLFLDINSTSKQVSKSLAFRYDGRDLLNVMIKELIFSNRENKLSLLKIDQKERIVRPSNKNWMSFARLNRFLSYLLFNTNKLSARTSKIIAENQVEILNFLEQYLESLIEVFPEDFGNVQKYLLGHEAYQNALAIASHKKIIQIDGNKFRVKENWQDYMESLAMIDFTPENPKYEHLIVQRKGFKGFKDNKHSETLPILMQEWEEEIQEAAIEMY